MVYEVREDTTVVGGEEYPQGVWFIVDVETREKLPFGAFLKTGLEIARDICFAMNAAHEQRRIAKHLVERRTEVAHDGSAIERP